jgi:DtxR family transcriptional regulator, Mn-dependent transcriptional regulator
MITVSKEDYLKAILEAESEGQEVISATLAHWMSVSAPAVTMALRRLKKDGLVRVQPDGRVLLTNAGREIARRLTTRHHLIERMLHEVFGMEWFKVHEEAERLEHAVSADFEALLAAKIGRGGVCPHGNQMIPESATARKRRGLTQLAFAETGRDYRVDSIYERDHKLLEFLDSLGVRPHAQVKVSNRNYDQTLTLQTDHGTVPLGHNAAEQVWVSLIRQENRSAARKAQKVNAG